MYNVLRREFQADQLFVPLAGSCVSHALLQSLCALICTLRVQEMSALSAYLAGSAATGKPYPQHHIDTAVSSYITYAKKYVLRVYRNTIWYILIGITLLQQSLAYSTRHIV